MHQTHAVDVQVIRGRNNRRAGAMVLSARRAVQDNTCSTGFVVMSKRWVVERTHAWNERARRLIHAPRPVVCCV